MEQKTIPYKIYLNESEMPEYWYNLRADMPKKPAPDMIAYALAELHVSPAEAVYIGDSEVDVKTAENAALPGIFVNWGFRDEAELRGAGARVIVSSPEELRGMLIG